MHELRMSYIVLIDRTWYQKQLGVLNYCVGLFVSSCVCKSMFHIALNIHSTYYSGKLSATGIGKDMCFEQWEGRNKRKRFFHNNPMFFIISHHHLCSVLIIIINEFFLNFVLFTSFYCNCIKAIFIFDAVEFALWSYYG